MWNSSRLFCVPACSHNIEWQSALPLLPDVILCSRKPLGHIKNPFSDCNKHDQIEIPDLDLMYVNYLLHQAVICTIAHSHAERSLGWSYAEWVKLHFSHWLFTISQIGYEQEWSRSAECVSEKREEDK